MSMKWKFSLDARWVAVLVMLPAVFLAAKYEPHELPLNPQIAAQFVSFFTQLAAIALFVERALEVLVTPWREKDAKAKTVAASAADDALKAHVDQVIAAGVSPKDVADATSVLQQKAQDSAQDLTEYRTDTQRIAFAASMAIGVAVSLAGFRALDFFVQGGVTKALETHPRQLMFFQALDVLLTGAVISGGADGLHQIVTIFTNFADSTKDKTKSS